MRWWPFQHYEERADAGNTVAEALLNSASGGVPASDTLGAAESSIAIWSRSLSAAQVEPVTTATSSLTPSTLSAMGRALGSAGEYCALIEVSEAGGVVLRQAAAWQVVGGIDPDEWLYRLELQTPGGLLRRTVPGAGVVHLRINVPATSPWRGVSPLAASKATSQLASWVERGLTMDSSMGAGQIIAVPDGATAQQVTQAKTALSAGRGKVSLIETSRAGWGAGTTARPAADYQQRRFGPEPASSSIALRTAVRGDVFSVFGVAESAIAGSGAAARESYRRFLATTLRPIANICESELSDKLGVTLTLKFPELQAADITAKTRSLKALVDSGYSKEAAALMVGLG